MSKPTTPSKSQRGADRPGVRLRVIGLGNPFAGDDGVGLEIISRLRVRGATECELLAPAQAGAELLDVLLDAEAVLFIDAVTSGSPPGTLHLVPLPCAGIEPRALVSLSSHGWGLVEALELMRVLGRRIPRLMLLGVEVGSVAPGALRSEAVEGAIRTVVERFSSLGAVLAEGDRKDWRSPRSFRPGEASFPGDL